jgi:hypothetical protein
VWSPIKTTDASHLEKVQRKATRVVPGIRDLPYRERLQQLKLPNLVYRRQRGDMIQTYKIIHGIKDITEYSLLKLAEEGPVRGHSLQLQNPRCRTALRQHFLSHRVIENWNRLPELIIIAASVNAITGRLDKQM